VNDLKNIILLIGLGAFLIVEISLIILIIGAILYSIII